MRTANSCTIRLLSCVLVVALCGIPEALQAQSAAQTRRHGISGEEPPPQDQRTPVEPAVSGQDTGGEAAALPDAPSSSRLVAQAQAAPVPPADAPVAPPDEAGSAATTPTPNQDAQTPPAAQKPAQEPAGAAAAQTGVTSGGAASKPAGMAIAPAKQRQVRSLFIKLGAIAAGGAAIGAVVALSKGSPSKPPGAK